MKTKSASSVIKKIPAGTVAGVAVCARPPWCDIICALHSPGQPEGVHSFFMADERPTESTRDRVRALVREVLKNASPAEEGGGGAEPSSESPPLARVVNVA